MGGNLERGGIQRRLGGAGATGIGGIFRKDGGRRWWDLGKIGGNRGRGWWNLGRTEVKKIGGNPEEVGSATGKEKGEI